MDREGAETHLRLLAEAELRHATTRPADGGLLDECHSARLELVAQALHAVRAFDMAAANEIQAELALALGVRQPRQGPAGPVPYAQANLAWLMQSARYSTAPHRTPSPHAPWRVVPVGRVIRTRVGDVQGEVHLLTYMQTAAGARFTAISYRRPDQVPERHSLPPGAPPPGAPPPGVVHAGRFTAVDDQGTGYQFGVSPGPSRTEWSGVLDLRTSPPQGIRWLDLSPTPGGPATRIDLTSQPASPPEITVTPAAVEPGELLLTEIAAGFLALASPDQVPLHPSAARPGPLSQAADGLADIIAALQAGAALSPSSRLPGQLAGLCTRLGIGGHGIAAPPAGDLPEPWLSMLAYCRRGKPERVPGPDWAVTAIELPELDGARITVLGLHNGGDGQFLHLLASGVTPEWSRRQRTGLVANRASGTGYSGHDAAGLRPALTGPVAAANVVSGPMHWCRDEPHCLRPSRCARCRLRCRQVPAGDPGCGRDAGAGLRGGLRPGCCQPGRARWPGGWPDPAGRRLPGGSNGDR
jgi:hypothetical protein